MIRCCSTNAARIDHNFAVVTVLITLVMMIEYSRNRSAQIIYLLTDCVVRVFVLVTLTIDIDITTSRLFIATSNQSRRSSCHYITGTHFNGGELLIIKPTLFSLDITKYISGSTS